MKSLLCLFILGMGIMACTEKKLPEKEVLSMLQQMEELATVEFTVTKVVKANDNKTWFKPGDRKILITTEATLKAGINMSELNADNIHVSGRSIAIYLPEPKILSVNMPPGKIKVAFEKTDLLRYPFNNEERDDLLRQAEQQLRNSGNETGILSQAKLNTQILLSRLLTGLGYESVELFFGERKNSRQKG